MKNIKLQNLVINNFKGIKDFILAPKGANINIFADNGAGKTTLFDAFCWVMFDKDSKGQSQFEIKTLDPAGNVLHNLEHSVEIELSVNEKSLKLAKVFKEKWTKKRGSIHQEFSGHTTDYYVDEVPAKKKEYQEAVKNIIEENTFKLLTSPDYFNTLHWTERRKILTNLVEFSDQEVLKDKKFAKLAAVLADKTVDNYKKILAEKKKKTNKDIESIPPRIDELNNSLEGIELSKEDIQKEKEKILAEKKELEKELVSADSDKIADIKIEISEVRNNKKIDEIKKKIELKNEEKEKINEKLNEIKNNFNISSLEKINKLKESGSNSRLEYQEAKNKISELENNKKDLNKELENANKKILEKRKEWMDVNKEQPSISDVCPTCHQKLPADEIAEAQERFNLNKSKKLAEINETGAEIRSSLKVIQEKIDTKNIELEKVSKILEKNKNEMFSLKSEIEKLEEEKPKIEDNKEYQKTYNEISAVLTEIDDYKKDITILEKNIENKISDLNSKIENIENKDKTANLFVEEKIKDLENKISDLDKEFAKYTFNSKTKNRINELCQQEKDLAALYENLEGETYLIEEFIKAKVSMLEGKINAKFEYANFKLFDTQVNGGINEVCETTYKGVPYTTSLNNGARINVGLDIINTLSDFYECQAPIFIDNAESVVDLFKVKSQLIKLFVDGTYKELTVK